MSQPHPVSHPQSLVGDVIFIRIGAAPFRQVASATNTWTNHVGIVLSVDGAEPLIGESRFPLSGVTTFSRFIARSEDRRYAIARLRTALTVEQQHALRAAAQRRNRVWYDTGFNLYSKRQYCSRYVREVLAEASGVQVGEIQTFTELLEQQPCVNLKFWKAWYFGAIPWQRHTVTPASLLRSADLPLLYDSAACAPKTSH